ncbi:mannose-6-phosphate isomerase, putative, partial [Ichthyophthirius multifiliis]
MELQVGYQTYEWGKIGSESFVYNLLNSEQKLTISEKKPYAELWMGTHQNCPSYIKNKNSKQKSLIEVIKSNPKYYLGQNKNYQLPFLFKVLSVNKSLSIQAHPDKKLAEKLHIKYPEIYKDDNHKPEMCIALSEFETFCNFCKPEEILQNIQENEELRNLINDENAINNFEQVQSKENLEILLKKVIYADIQNLEVQILKLIQRIKNKKIKIQEINQYLEQMNNSPIMMQEFSFNISLIIQNYNLDKLYQWELMNLMHIYQVIVLNVCLVQIMLLEQDLLLNILIKKLCVL